VGVFERPKGSGIYWICYFDQFGRKHREKVGLKQTAIYLYQQRKTEIRLDKFKPEDVKDKHKNASLAQLIEERLILAQNMRSFSDERERLLWWKQYFGDRSARSIGPNDIEKARAELSKKVSVGTVNRYLTALKTCFSLALRNHKLERNPVSEVKFWKENNCRVRYLLARM
jgi:hypothetical protein